MIQRTRRNPFKKRVARTRADAGATTLTFLGGAQMVTGSRYLLAAGGEQYLIDCGLFQGSRKEEALNWEPFPVDPSDLAAVVLTHAHLDHTGYVPLLVAGKQPPPVYASEATCALLGLLLPDAGHLQEEEARYANKKGYSRYKPALPLFTAEQAVDSLKSLVPVAMDTEQRLGRGASMTMRPAGHILGSSIVECRIAKKNGHQTIVFSGDLGRFGQEFMKPPTLVHEADYLVVESTYGDRDHPSQSPEDGLEPIILDTYRRRGVLVIPSFAVGRTQEVLYSLRKLEDQERIPHQTVYVDSPMATAATEIYRRFGDEHNLGADLLADDEQCPLLTHDTRFTRDVEASKALNETPGPFIVISASGMAEGGRVMHHLKHRLPDANNTVLLVGFQAQGTRGRMLREGAKSLKLLGEVVPVNAHVEALDTFSAHGDRSDLIHWLKGFQRPPKQTFIIHGEPSASEALKAQIERELGWNAHIPERLESVTLT